MSLQFRFLKSDEAVTNYKHDFPVVIEPTQDASLEGLIKLLTDQRADIFKLLNKFGAILLRGFAIKEPLDFEKSLLGLELNLSTNYFDPQVRRSFSRFTFSSAEMPVTLPILGHNEMFYCALRPMYLSFFCLKPDESSGGQTPLFNTVSLYQNLPEKLKKIFQAPILVKHFFDQTRLSYLDQSGFKTKKDIENLLTVNHMTAEWDGDQLIATLKVPSIVRHPETSEECLQLSLYNLNKAIYLDFFRRFKAINFDEGLMRAYFYLFGNSVIKKKIRRLIQPIYQSDISKQDWLSLCDVLWQHATLFNWQKGDLLLFDNLKIAHGRMPCTKDRKIIASQGNLIDVNKISAMA